MTDRDLLGLAAKAAGMKPPHGQGGYIRRDGGFCYYLDCEGKTSRIWNPLTDDGDALRLRNKLSAMIVDEGNCVFVGVYRYNLPSIEIREIYHSDTDNVCASAESIGASTRRAIVRAAAAIGAGIMQSQPATEGLPEDNYYKTMAEAEGVAGAEGRP